MSGLSRHLKQLDEELLALGEETGPGEFSTGLDQDGLIPEPTDAHGLVRAPPRRISQRPIRRRRRILHIGFHFF